MVLDMKVVENHCPRAPLVFLGSTYKHLKTVSMLNFIVHTQQVSKEDVFGRESGGREK